MFENHMRLKSAREDGRQLELDVKNKKELLEREKQKNARLEQDVKNYKDRQVFLEKINTLKMKRPWVVSYYLDQFKFSLYIQNPLQS